MKLIRYHRPTTLEEARRLLKELGPSGLPLAGATSHAFMKGDDEKTAVDLAWLGYDRIATIDGGFTVGANTRIADLQQYHAPGWVLDRVALRFVNQPIRNMTTIGGNIARVFPWNDFPVVLLALGADMIVTGEVEAVHPADTYFKGQPARLFQPGDLLTEIRVPAIVPGVGFGYHKETVVNMAFSALTLAVRLTLDKRMIADVRIAAGAGIPLPARLTAIEQALMGRPISTETIQQALDAQVDAVTWKGGDGFSDAYVRQLARVHLEDVLIEAWQAAKGGAA
ncbi:MAG TPA: FAD binding domain-containing protein [Kiritimatiellia bacterium]|nr:FAD binding domain-containing protein [Kiritimatiellia bacterium]HMP00777.1 FAD binding domain-containing protein [Kiritimatiellia bacterium]HMP96737.1 FAD binding domain-containing protein [Kiritimatiellia bacterium]